MIEDFIEWFNLSKKLIEMKPIETKAIQFSSFIKDLLLNVHHNQSRENDGLHFHSTIRQSFHNFILLTCMGYLWTILRSLKRLIRILWLEYMVAWCFGLLNANSWHFWTIYGILLIRFRCFRAFSWGLF